MNSRFRAVLDALPPFDLSDVPALRRRLADVRPAVVAPQDPRVQVRDLVVPGQSGAPDIRVRTYRPVGAPPAAPALLYVHGGGFVLGDLDTEAPRCFQLCAETQYVVVAVNYRLAPEHPYPAAFEDCRTVLLWMWDGAGPLGLDRDRLAVGGSSAGGAIAASLALWARDNDGPGLAFQLLIYPVLDDRLENDSVRRYWDTPGWNGCATSQMWAHYLSGSEPAGDAYAAPARATGLQDLPPAYILVAGEDPLRDEGLEYAARLQSAGVPTEVREVPGLPHGFDQFVPDAPVSRQSLAEQVAVLKRFAEVRV